MAIKIVLTGDDKSLTEALKNAATKVRQLGDEYEKAGDKASEAAEEAKKGASKAEQATMRQLAFAKRLVRQNETAAQTYKRQLLALIQARKENTITAQQYRQTVDSLKQKMRELNAEKPDFKEAFSPSPVLKFAASFVSVASAIGVVRQALEFFKREKEDALEIGTTLEQGRRTLAQVSGGDAQRFQQLVTKADQIAEVGGMSREEATDLLFTAVSEGFEDQVIALAKNFQVTGAAPLRSIGQISSLMNLTPQQALAAGMSGSAASRANNEELFKVVPLMAANMSEGMDAAEAMGFLASFINATAKPTMAANRTGTLLSIANRKPKEFGGLGFNETINKMLQMRTDFMAGRETEAAQFYKETFSGNKEASEALAFAAKNMGGQVAEFQGNIRREIGLAGTSEGIAARSLAAVASSDTPIGRRVAARLEMQREAVASEAELEGRAAVQGAQERAAALRLNRRLAEGDTTITGAAPSPITRLAGQAGTLTGEQLGLGGRGVEQTGGLFARLSEIGMAFGQAPVNPGAMIDLATKVQRQDETRPERMAEQNRQNEARQERMANALESIDAKLDNQPLQPSEQQGQ